MPACIGDVGLHVLCLTLLWGWGSIHGQRAADKVVEGVKVAQAAAAGLLAGHPWVETGCGGAESDTSICVSPQSPIAAGSCSELAWVCSHLPCLSASVPRC